MIAFLLIYFLVYGLMHAFVLYRLRASFTLGTFSLTSIAIFMALMVLAPIIVRLFERSGREFAAEIFSYIGYTWMGFIFVLFSVSLFFTLVHFIAGFILKQNPANTAHITQIFFVFSCLIAAILCVYGYFEALNIRAETITINSPKIPESVGRLRIVQVSDIHLGLIVGTKRLSHIIKKVEEARPDIIVSTGDLIDANADGVSQSSSLFKDVTPKYGKFAVTGNHEFYSGIKRSVAITENAGFKILRGQSADVEGIINIAGVDDPAAKHFGKPGGDNEVHLLTQLPKNKFTILLKHQPTLAKGSAGLFDLQLSGHTHKGQLFPFNYMVRIVYRYIAGLYKLPGGSLIYVSRGTGTWGPPFRILAPPQITVIDLLNSKSSTQ